MRSIMRYNASELKQMASVSGGKLCSKEGILSLREKEGKLWNKTDVLTERWCRLVDNLFFYFKTKDSGSDIYGVFVLEGSHVHPVPGERQGCAFILDFEGDNRSTYFLASKPSEAQEWIKALENASYTKLKQQYEQLMKQQNKIHKEKMPEDSKKEQSSNHLQAPIRETRSANSSPMPQRRVISPTDQSVGLSDTDDERSRPSKKKTKKKNKTRRLIHPDSTAPILEAALTCKDLHIPKVIDHKRTLIIRVLSSVPKVLSQETALTLIFTTESVRAATAVEFASTLSFYQTGLITPNFQLLFRLCQIKENKSIQPLGHSSCTVGDLLKLSRPLVLDIESTDHVLGKLQIDVLRETMSSQFTKASNESQLTSVLLSTGNLNAKKIESKLDSSFGDIGRNPNLKSLYCQAISRTYRFPTAKCEYISVQEIMLETRLSFHTPELYIKLLIEQESECIGTLNSLNFLSERLQLSRKQHVESKKALIEQYNEALKGIVNHAQNFSFKASVQKVNKELEFAPTNLHLQRMRVQHSECMSVLSVDSKCSTCTTAHANGIHDIVTVGAATAHCLKYKQGGLLSLLTSDKSKKDWLSAISDKDNHNREISEIPVILPKLKKEISSHRSALEVMLQAGKEHSNVPNRQSLETCVSQLNNKVCHLIAILDNEQLCKALHILLKQQTNGPSSTSSLVGAANSLISASGVEWDGMKTAVSSKLKDIVNKSHKMLDAADDLLSLNPGSSSPPTCDEILDDMKELDKRLQRVLNLALEGHAIHVMQSPKESEEILYRRDVVFSQVLSTCVCGVATNLLTSLREGALVDNIVEHGMLMEFESLLSTYKNELGMLEDYMVGVFDLQKVTFCCERAPEQVGNNMDHLLPTLHGTRGKILVKLHLDPSVFEMLPTPLKNGSTFTVVPVIFNIGINEEQTLADKLGSSSLQDYANNQSYSRLNRYCQSVKKWLNDSHVLDGLLNRLYESILSKKTKNVEILQLAAEVCRSVNGVRVTSCKSAKDRTAMSVTLEQAQVLIDYHEISPEIRTSMIGIMRTEGTRRENTRKNVGVKKYAFTGVQLMTFPKQYRPPEGTYGKTDS